MNALAGTGLLLWLGLAVASALIGTRGSVDAGRR